MKSRHAVAALAGLALVIAPIAVTAGPASAASGAAVAAPTLISSTTLVKATQVVGTTPGKVVIGIQVKVASGAIATGSVTLTVDNGIPVTLVLKANGRASYTHHYKVGAHSVVATYLGSATDATSSSAPIPFSVS